MNNNYWIKMTNKQSASEGYSFSKFAFEKDIARETIKAMRVLHPAMAWSMVPEGSLSGICEPQKKEYEPSPLLFAAVELHLSPHTEGWTRKFGKKVKEAGGTYSACRGTSDTRYVVLPVAAWELINEIVRFEVSYRIELGTKSEVKVPMIARGLDVPGYNGQYPSWMSVHYWNRHLQEANLVNPFNYVLASVWESVASAIERGIIKKIESAPMITVPPMTPITAKDRIMAALSKIDSAIEHMKRSNVNHTPIWSDLHAARMEAQDAIAKLA